MSLKNIQLLKCNFLTSKNPFKSSDSISIDNSMKPKNGNFVLVEHRQKKLIAQYKKNHNKKYLVLLDKIDAIEINENTKILGVINKVYISLSVAA